MSSAKIKKCIKDRKLSSAIKLLSSRVDSIGNYDLKSSFENVENTYRAMLTYMLQGYMDDDYSLRRNELVQNIFALNDQADRLERLMSGDKQSRYVSAYKIYGEKSSFGYILLRLEADLAEEDHEEEVCRLFNYVWTSNIWTKGDYEAATELLNSSDVDVNDKSLFISAVTLSLMEYFDEKKIHTLFDAYLTPEMHVSQRALVGLVFVIRMYDLRLEFYPSILARLNLYAEDGHFVREMFTAMLLLQYSKMTDSVTDKVQSHIMPEILKFRNKTERKSGDEIFEEMTRNGENPEWMDDKVLDSIKEMQDMQLEGADVYLASFRYMKGYPFFNKIPHWFYPFDINKKELQDVLGDGTGAANLIVGSSVFCDSDKYSFCYMLKSMGVNGNKLMEQEIKSQMYSDEDREMLNDVLNKKNISNRDICKLYIFDLYRFYKCYSFNNQFENPFETKRKNADGKEFDVHFSPLKTKAFDFMKSYRDEMIALADFFMRKGFYDDAIELFTEIEPLETEEDAGIWQKLGFCKQKTGKDKTALKMYMMADELLPDSKWTMKHIVQIAMKMEMYEVAMKYLDLLLVQDDENLKFITQKAVCQIELLQFNDALTTLFKADYIEENSTRIMSMMVECYLKNNQLEKAKEKLAAVVAKDDCMIEMRILNALLSLRFISKECAYYCLREAQALYENANANKQPFDTIYRKIVEDYGAIINVDSDIAYMILDSVELDIR